MRARQRPPPSPYQAPWGGGAEGPPPPPMRRRRTGPLRAPLGWGGPLGPWVRRAARGPATKAPRGIHAEADSTPKPLQCLRVGGSGRSTCRISYYAVSPGQGADFERTTRRARGQQVDVKKNDRRAAYANSALARGPRTIPVLFVPWPEEFVHLRCVAGTGPIKQRLSPRKK